MKLTTSTINKLNPSTKATASRPDKVTDGNGLQLLVRTTGTKSWVTSYYWQGKRQAITLGKWPAVSLKEARAKNLRIKQLIDRDINPKTQLLKERQNKAGSNLYHAIATRYLAQHASQTKQSTSRAATSLYNRHIKPVLGNKAVEAITPLDIMKLARVVENKSGSEQAKRAVRQIRQVLAIAIVEGLTTHNVANDLADMIKPEKTKHRARIRASQLPKLLADIEAYNGHRMVKIGLLLLAHTFVRTSELVEMSWHEIDLEKGTWTIPGERMKMGRPHIIPLTPYTIALLNEIKEMGLKSDYVFYNKRTGKHYNRNAFNRALVSMGYADKMTAHGFRALASTTLHEQGYSSDVIETQLSHVKSDAVNRAYNGAQYLTTRMKMMKEWSAFIESLRGKPVTDVIYFDSLKGKEIKAV